MSKKAPLPAIWGTKPLKRRSEKFFVRFASAAEFCIRTVVALHHRPRAWQSEGCPANRHSKAHCIAGLRFSKEAVPEIFTSC